MEDPHFPSGKDQSEDGSYNDDRKPEAKDGGIADTSHATVSQEDDDDWSRQVETDETTAHLGREDSYPLTESIAEIEKDDIEVQTIPQPQSQRELTLKEKLVMRERERRIETERARLKRQFALRNAGTSLVEGEERGETVNDESTTIGELQGEVLRADTDVSRENESVTETLGEASIVAHPDEENAGEGRIGFNMERFLRNSDVFNPQLEPTDERKETPDQGVLMERFLNEPVHPQTAEGEARSVTFGMDPIQGASSSQSIPGHDFDAGGVGLHGSSLGLADSDVRDLETDPLMAVSLDGQNTVNDSASTVTTTDEPRVLRLTEADMQELAAIDEVSIGNAPPSEREEILSEIGELADFGGLHHGGFPTGTLSLDTQTTAMDESATASLVSGIQSTQPIFDHDHHSDHRSIEAANRTRTPSPQVSLHGSEDAVAPNQCIRNDSTPLFRGARHSTNAADATAGPVFLGEIASSSSGNRNQIDVRAESQPFHRASPEEQLNGLSQSIRPSPVPPEAKTYADLGSRQWSPGCDMHVSPLNQTSKLLDPVIVDYGGLETGEGLSKLPRMPSVTKGREELDPLIPNVPPEIITRRNVSNDNTTEGRNVASLNGEAARMTTTDGLNSLGSVKGDSNEGRNEPIVYLQSSSFVRACPERLVALLVTLVLELPVLFIVSGGSDQLCMLIGRKRYQLMMGFMPLVSATSGNVGLQSSTLTTRAVSHEHITRGSYVKWVRAELEAAAFLGVGMGAFFGILAFVVSGQDLPFAATIVFAQFVSIFTAGLSGTMAPLLFTFIFQKDSGKLGGPLETAIQDIVGSFSMVILSYHLLRFLGTGEIQPDDVCGAS